ncbi:MAG TPA: peptidylprolyl isomerase [Saprospiraceae bacterium]|nr:transcriptional regulator [Saprospirales bacterium]HRQ29613.1 peptidylprolyl isomerase [Saprospiraceae bacterium]
MKQNFSGLLILLSGITFFGSCSKPIAHFIIEPEEEVIASSVLKFKNTSKNAEKYSWEFGDGTISESPDPEHQYFHSGHYEIRLIASKGGQSSVHRQQITVHAPKTCHVLIKTNLGDMIVELFDNTPLHRDNFIHLVEQGFYNDLLFHRVVEGFVIQGGDPSSRNAPLTKKIITNGNEHKIEAEFNPENIHLKGALAAARMGDQVNPEKKSSGHQFYLVHGSKVLPETLDHAEHSKNFRYSSAQKNTYFSFGGSPQLDMEYTVFGRIIHGLDVLDAIARTKTNAEDRPLENVWMKLSVIN